jgi:hypothetical protein
MTIEDLTTGFPNFRKSLNKLNQLRESVDYLQDEEEIEKSLDGIDLKNKAIDILNKVEENNEEVDFTPDVPEPEKVEQMKNPVPPVPEIPPKKLSTTQEQTLLPKLKEISDVDRQSVETTPAQISPQDNYESQKYGRLTELSATRIKSEISNYNKRIQEAIMSQKEGWPERASTDFGGMTAVYEFRDKISNDGLTGALDWLSESIKDEKERLINPFDYLETTEASEFDNDFREKLKDNEYYINGYLNSMKNIYESLAAQAYKAFVEDADDLQNPYGILTAAVADLPRVKNPNVASKLLKEAVSDSLMNKYKDPEMVKELMKHIGYHIDKNYNGLNVDGYRKPLTIEERNKYLSEFRDSDTLSHVLSVHAYRNDQTDQLTLDKINKRDMPIVVNKFVAELKRNPNFQKYKNSAEVVAAKIFGDEFERNYDEKKVKAFEAGSPYYLKNMMSLVQRLVEDYNNDTPRPFKRLMFPKMKGREGQITRDDVNNISAFFKENQPRLEKFIEEKDIHDDDPRYLAYSKLRDINKAKALSYMTDSDKHAAVYLDNILTENRGVTSEEQRLGKNYFKEGFAYFTNPINNKKLYLKDVLNSPMFVDPDLLSYLLNRSDANLKSTGAFRTFVKEILPLVTGAYYTGRDMKDEDRIISGEEIAEEDVLNNPFVQRLRNSTKSTEAFREFSHFIKNSMNDVGEEDGMKWFDVGMFGDGVTRFFRYMESPAPLDDESIQMKPIRPQTAFEKVYHKSTTQHAHTMNNLEQKNGVSDNAEIGDTLQSFAVPIYKEFFPKMLKLWMQEYDGVNVEAQKIPLRKDLLKVLNRDVAPALYRERRNVPFNYMADVYDIQDKEIQNGILEAKYLLESFDKPFLDKLLTSGVNEKGIINPDEIIPKPAVKKKPRVEKPIENVPVEQPIVVPEAKPPEEVIPPQVDLVPQVAPEEKPFVPESPPMQPEMVPVEYTPEQIDVLLKNIAYDFEQTTPNISNDKEFKSTMKELKTGLLKKKPAQIYKAAEKLKNLGFSKADIIMNYADELATYQEFQGAQAQSAPMKVEAKPENKEVPLPETSPMVPEPKMEEAKEEVTPESAPKLNERWANNIGAVRADGKMGKRMAKNQYLAHLLKGNVYTGQKVVKKEYPDGKIAYQEISSHKPWEKATDEERQNALYKALLQMATNTNPNGVISHNLKDGLDYYLDKDWVLKNFDKYIKPLLKEGETLLNARKEKKSFKGDKSFNKQWSEAVQKIAPYKSISLTDAEQKEMDDNLSKSYNILEYINKLISSSDMRDERKAEAESELRSVMMAVESGYRTDFENRFSKLMNLVSNELITDRLPVEENPLHGGDINNLLPYMDREYRIVDNNGVINALVKELDKSFEEAHKFKNRQKEKMTYLTLPEARDISKEYLKSGIESVIDGRVEKDIISKEEYEDIIKPALEALYKAIDRYDDEAVKEIQDQIQRYNRPGEHKIKKTQYDFSGLRLIMEALQGAKSQLSEDQLHEYKEKLRVIKDAENKGLPVPTFDEVKLKEKPSKKAKVAKPMEIVTHEQFENTKKNLNESVEHILENVEDENFKAKIRENLVRLNQSIEKGNEPMVQELTQSLVKDLKDKNLYSMIVSMNDYVKKLPKASEPKQTKIPTEEPNKELTQLPNDKQESDEEWLKRRVGDFLSGEMMTSFKKLDKTVAGNIEIQNVLNSILSEIKSEIEGNEPDLDKLEFLSQQLYKTIDFDPDNLSPAQKEAYQDLISDIDMIKEYAESKL